MAKAEEKKEDESSLSIEYTIYVFRHPADQDEGEVDWELIKTSDDMDATIKEAEDLHKSNKYQKVEVKKKFVDPKKGRTIDMTLKAFDNKPKKPIPLALIIVFAVVCGAAAFGLTFFLAGGR